MTLVFNLFSLDLWPLFTNEWSILSFTWESNLWETRASKKNVNPSIACMVKRNTTVTLLLVGGRGRRRGVLESEDQQPPATPDDGENQRRRRIGNMKFAVLTNDPLRKYWFLLIIVICEAYNYSKHVMPTLSRKFQTYVTIMPSYYD